MKPASLLLSPLLILSALLAAGSLPVSAQANVGVPPIMPDSTTNAPLPQTLKLRPSAQPATLTVGRASYKSGQRVFLTFRIVNTSGKPVSYNFGSGQRYDITATDSNGTQVWDWTHGKLFSQKLSFVTLAPGKSVTYKAVWNGRNNSNRPVAPGMYALAAHLVSNNQPTVTNGIIVDTDRDPNNMGIPTRTRANTGAIRQVAPAPQVSAKTTVQIK